MPDTSVPITPATSGTTVNVDGFTQSNGDVRQAVVVGDATSAATQKVGTDGDAATSLTHPALAAAGVYAGLTGYGAQRVSPEASTLFSDTFEGTVPDANRWVSTGTVNLSNGAAYLGLGFTASTSLALTSRPLFAPHGSTFHGFGLLNSFENRTATAGATGILGVHRFFGVGQVPTTWVAAYTASATTGPLLNGVGFEVDTDGELYGVVYSNGVRVRAQVTGQAAGVTKLSTVRTVFDGRPHQFQVVFRTDVILFYVDGTEAPAATLTWRSTGFLVPLVQVLPVRLHSINPTTSPSDLTIHSPAAVALADTGRNSTQLSDGTYPWREAVISRSGGLAVEMLPRPTYTTGLSGFAATNVGIVFSLSGSSTRVVRIQRVQVTCVAGAATNAILKVERLSTLAGGTAATPTTATTDTTNPAATAVGNGWTATPTSAVLAQHLGQRGSGGTLLQWDWMWGDVPEQQPTLRGTAQWFALRNLVAIATSGSWHVTITWTEEVEGA